MTSQLERAKIRLRNQSTHPLVLPAYLAWRRWKSQDKGFSPAASVANAMFSRPSFSQYGEDVVLSTIFEGVTDGFYVDVGCFHPYLISNTYLLYRRGWKGLNIDPSPQAVRAFKRARPRDTMLQFAVTNRTGRLQYDLNGVFSSLQDEEAGSSTQGAASIEVTARPLSVILDDYLPGNGRIDLLDVDCEGHDYEVLESNDWDRYRPSVVLAEWQGSESRREVAGFLEARGYRLVVALHMTGIFAESTFFDAHCGR